MSETFVLNSPTTEEVEEGREVQLPCGLYARVISSLSTPRQAQEFKRAFQEVGGKKALNDPTRVTGAKAVRASILVVARYNLLYLRTPNDLPLSLRGVSKNGDSEESQDYEFGAKIEGEHDLARILETFPEIRQQVRDAIEAEGESLEEIAGDLSGN